MARKRLFRVPVWAWAGVALGLAVVGYFLLHDSSARTFTEYRVEPKRVGVSLIERGSLVSQAIGTAKILAEGTVTEIVETGKPVKKGEVLLKIDTSQSENDVRSMQIELQKLEIDKTLAGRRLEVIKFTEARKLALNRQQLEYARLQLREGSKAMTDEERRLLEIDQALSRLDLADATEDYQQQKRLFEKQFISAAMLETYERKSKTAQAHVDELVVKQRLKEKGIPVEQRLELETNVTQMQAIVARGEVAMARRIDETRKDIDITVAQIAQKRYQLALKQEEMKNSTSFAETDGIAKRREFIDWRSGGKWSEYRPGTKVHMHDGILDIIDPRQMRVNLMINEVDFNRLRKGMPVAVTMPAFPGRTFTGELTAMGGIGRDRLEVAPRGQESRPTQVTMFNASVVINSSDAQTQPGMSAMVEFEIDPPAPRLVIPRRAVYEKDGKFVVYRRSMGGATPVAIGGRVYNEQYFLVNNGIKDGDVICLDFESEGS